MDSTLSTYVIVHLTSGHVFLFFLDDDSLIITLVISVLPISKLVPCTLILVPPLIGPYVGLTD